MVAWLVTSFSYYGLALNSAALAGSIYTSFFLNWLVQLPAYGLAGRLAAVCGGLVSTVGWSLVLGGLCCLGIVLMPQPRAPAAVNALAFGGMTLLTVR